MVFQGGVSNFFAAGSDMKAIFDLTVFTNEGYECLKPLILKLFFAPAISVTGERVFNQAGLITWPIRCLPNAVL